MDHQPAADVLTELAQPGGRLFLFVMDGLGGLPHPETGRTELETARTPHMDELARGAALGLLTPIAPGITPGSAPAHLALFGYDPLAYRIGRGVLSAIGVGMTLEPGDVAARLNFATFRDGQVVDRRAGRLDTEVAARLCRRLNEQLAVPGVEVEVRPEMQYRAVMVLRGDGLDAALSDSDPQVTGRPPLPVEPLRPEARYTADVVNRLLAQAMDILAGEEPANGILVRGFGSRPRVPTLQERFGLRPAVIAPYPMYRGLAQLVGMTNVPSGPTLAEEAQALASRPKDCDYVFLHVKDTDAAGEDGDFDRKVAVIESFDAMLPRLLAEADLSRDVVVITGDHSTPAVLRAHSWHPVPALLAGPFTRGVGEPVSFGERACARGSLGSMRSQDLLPLMLAHAGRLKKFGA